MYEKTTADTAVNINHILIQTSDLSNMTSFLENVTKLTVGNRPPFPFPGVWLYHDHKPVIHLIEAHANLAQADYIGTRTLSTDGALDHIAFEGDDYNQLMARLEQYNVEFVERTVPQSRQHQVFIKGPDGLKLEILFNRNKTPFT